MVEAACSGIQRGAGNHSPWFFMHAFCSPNMKFYLFWGTKDIIETLLVPKVIDVKFIERTDYLKELHGLLQIPDIKVITGVHKSGKSKLLDALVSNLRDYSLTDFENSLDYHALEAYVEEHDRTGKNNYLMIDEVPMCVSFEKIINNLHANEA